MVQNLQRHICLLAGRLLASSLLAGSLLTLCLLPGCGSQESSHAFESRLEDGVPVAANEGGPRFDGDLFAYHQFVQLSQDPQVPESLLYPGATRRWDERGFVMDNAGWFYVQDRGNNRIAVFDPDGQYSRSLGGPGSGPGEFAFLHLTGISGDVLEIYDESQHRITLLRTDGTLVATLACPVGGGRVYLDHTNDVLVARSYLQEEREGVTMMAAGFQTVRRDGEPVGQGHTPLIEMYYAYEWIGHKGGIGGADIPFTSYPAMAWAPGRGVYLINGKQPIVWHYQSGGTLLKKITLDLPDRRVTAQDRRRYTQDLQRRVEESEGDEHDALLATLRTLTFFDTKSHWSSIAVDDKGHIWLEVAVWPDGPDAQPGATTLFQLLSPEGEFLGWTRAPAAGRVMNGYLLGVVADPETGREDHIVWRLTPAVAGFEYRGG